MEKCPKFQIDVCFWFNYAHSDFIGTTILFKTLGQKYISYDDKIGFFVFLKIFGFFHMVCDITYIC